MAPFFNDTEEIFSGTNYDSANFKHALFDYIKPIRIHELKPLLNYPYFPLIFILSKHVEIFVFIVMTEVSFTIFKYFRNIV